MFLEKRDCDKCERAILIMLIILYVPSLTVAAHTREVLKSFASNLAQLPPCLCSYLPHPSPPYQNLTTHIVPSRFHHHHLPPHHLQLLPSYFLETNKKVTSKMTTPFSMRFFSHKSQVCMGHICTMLLLHGLDQNQNKSLATFQPQKSCK